MFAWLFSFKHSRLKLFGEVITTPKCVWFESCELLLDEDDDDDEEDGDVVVEVNAELNVRWGGGGGDDDDRLFITDQALLLFVLLFNKLFDAVWLCCLLLEFEVDVHEDGEFNLVSFELVKLVVKLLDDDHGFVKWMFEFKLL